MYTKKHVRSNDMASDRELYSLVNLPHDLCSDMSHKTMGSVFDVNQFTSARRADQKRFTQVMVKVIADKATPSPCQRCMCVAQEKSGASMSVCKSCSSSSFSFTEVSFCPHPRLRYIC